MTLDDFRHHLRAYLIEQRELPADWACDDDDNLFDRGVVESFDLPGLVAFLERLAGAELDLAGRRIEVFYTVRAMHAAFLGGL